MKRREFILLLTLLFDFTHFRFLCLAPVAALFRHARR
jgi:hypothetical protein